MERLRLAIDCLPVATREAMLEGVRASERIIVGAYVDEHGGVCPMVAAHRNGGRTDFLSFAKSWDRFAGRPGKRAATRREVAILIAQLEGSLLCADGLGLDEAIREHRALRRARMEHTRGLRRRLLARGGDPAGEVAARDLRARDLRARRSGGRGRGAATASRRAART